MAEATELRDFNAMQYTAMAAYNAGDVVQLRDGRAAYFNSSAGAALGDRITFETSGQVTINKSPSVSLLDGDDVYWDYTNNRCNFRKTLNSKDFFVGTVVGDAAQADTLCTANLNLPAVYAIDLLRDEYSFDSVYTGTQGLNTMGIFPRGGMSKMILSVTNEAQKLDMLTFNSMAIGCRGIVKIKINVRNTGAGAAPDFNIGLASGTHATDADSIAQHLFCHLDGNSTNINFQSKDGTHTVAATSSGVTYTAGTPFEVWLDLRDPTSVKLYIDGVRVLSGTTFDVSAAATGPWKVLAHLEKTAAADVYEVDCMAKLRHGDQSVLSV